MTFLRRILTAATIAVVAALPMADLASAKQNGGKGNGAKQDHTCQGGHNCNTTVIEGDDDGDGQVEYRCYSPSGGYIVVSTANCTNVFFPILVVIDT